MADVTITIPDAVFTEVVDALCAVGDWQPSNGPRPAFAKQVLINYIKQVTINRRKATDASAAAQAAQTAATTALSNVT